MSTLAQARSDLAVALAAGLTGTELVTSTPARAGALDRHRVIVTIGHVTPGPDPAELTAELTVQVSADQGIGEAYDLMDAVLEAIVPVLPINWQLPSWSIDPDQDGQPVLWALAELRGHRTPAVVVGGTQWSQAGIQWSQAGLQWNGA